MVLGRQRTSVSALPPIAGGEHELRHREEPMSLTNAFGASQPMIGPLMKL